MGSYSNLKVSPAALSALTFLIVLLLLTGALSPASLLAQGDGSIRVVESTRQNKFPNGIDFSVTVESDSQIQQIRLNYRIIGARVWSYANSVIEPGQRVMAEFTGLIGNPVYLPPGTVVEHFYTIEDSSGNILETSTETLVYTDDRFDWQEINVGPLTLNYHDVGASTIEELAERLEPQLAAVVSLLELSEPRPIKGFIYNDRQEATPAFPFYSRTITERQVFHGFAFPQNDVFLGIGFQPGLIVHESAHLMLAQSLEGSGRTIPSWLDEGFASYVEPGSRPYSGQSLSGRGLPLEAMSSLSGTPEDIEYFYLKAESVVAFMIEEYGVDAFQNFLASLRRGSTVDQALRSAYGFDSSVLEANWAASDLGKPVPSPRRFSPETPFLLFNSWFLGILILAVMTVVLVRLVYRKFHPSEGDYHDWDD